jgi:tight adherence protein C
MNILLITGLVAIAAVLLFIGVRQAFVEPPDEDRTFKDKPPLYFRVFWPIISVISFNLGGLITQNYRKKQQKKLTAAGFNFAINADQFFAAKVLGAIFCIAVSMIIFSPLGSPPTPFLIVAGLLGFFYVDIWLRDQTQLRQRTILKSFPFYLDIMTLSLEAGLNVNSALQQAVDKSMDGPLRVEFGRVLRDVRSGRTRAEAFQDFAGRVQLAPVTNWVSAVVHAEKQGANLAPLLRAQAEQRRVERFQRAEKLAMEAPVKMLGPLILCIMPCTFLIIGFPIAMKFVGQGLL